MPRQDPFNVSGTAQVAANGAGRKNSAPARWGIATPRHGVRCP